MVKRIAAVEAQDKLDTLLDLVAHGEEVVITRGGHEAARLIAMEPKPVDRKNALEALRRLQEAAREMNRGTPITLDEILSWRDEGRR